MTQNFYDRTPSRALSKNKKGEITKYRNPAIQLIGGIVELDESLKTFINNQRIDSSIISADYKTWSKYDRSQR
ncbi:hypothetical protein QUB05_17490 [Microcoleus sp. F10-C6]|uniref:hypothetical protein n=1 Tax=unclassified Microcoleus TaxID=2642155 RepID=UPI002FCF3743